MGWMQKLYETYENNAHMAGIKVAGKKTLVPVGHISQGAQIEITITEDGNFYGADIVDKADKETIIPATESSASRSSGVCAHPLCDMLPYIAGDYAVYADVKPDSSDVKKIENKFSDYMQKLSQWANSDFSHYKVKAIYAYCRKQTIIADLIKCGKIETDDLGKMTKAKIESQPYDKCLVRWRVLSDESDLPTETWADTTLFDSYIGYVASINEKNPKDICYISGKEAVPSRSHPKGTIAASYGAKLVSANDEANFTYKGRFEKPEEALTVSFEVSQKAHSALRWIVANQGVFYGGRVFVCFNPKGKLVPSVKRLSFFSEDDDEELRAYTMPEYQKKLFKAINGYRENLEDNDDVIIMSLEAATTGRLSVTYYNELKASDFLYRIKKWWDSCCWYYKRYSPEKKSYFEIQTPSIENLVKCAFGTEQGDFIAASDGVMKEHIQQVLNCVVNCQTVPSDIVRSLTLRASMPLAYKKKGNYDKVLSTACALIRKSRNDRSKENKGEELTMELDKNNSDRSYLFGRLLAIAEKIERSTYKNGEERAANAIRLQSAFQQHPMHTWRIIEEALNPYYQKLNTGSEVYYKNIIGEIWSTFKETDKDKLNTSLEDIYLIGYYLQRRELYTKNDNSKEDK